jgi:hypothetical protein
MPNTPKNIVPNRFQRHGYCRVSFTKKRSTRSAAQETNNLGTYIKKKIKLI